MNDTTAQLQPTPNRRRQGRQNGRQKAYASENDMGGIDVPHCNMSPATPQKDNLGSSAVRGNRTTGSKQRYKNKGPKTNATSTSPEPDLPKQRSTPRQPSTMNGIQPAAFAGATFHASPAPDALPMPSFFSKMTTGSPAAKEAPRPLQQPSPPHTVNEAPTPHRETGGIQGSDSPLDFMFKAHREERERHRNVNEPIGLSATTPPAHSPYGFGHRKAATAPQHRPVPVRHVSSGALDDEEFRGNFGQPLGPAFSTPYHDRIKAARPSNSQGTSGAGNDQEQDQRAMEDPSEALKRFLFNGNKTASNQSNAQPPQSGVTNQYSASSAYNSTPGGRNESIQDMEDSLRKILKIEPNSTTAPTERRLFMG